MSPAFSLTRYVIWTRRRAKREEVIGIIHCGNDGYFGAWKSLDQPHESGQLV